MLGCALRQLCRKKVSTMQAAKPIQCNEYNGTVALQIRIHKISQVNYCKHKGEHKVGYYYYYLAAGDEQRVDGLVPSLSHLTKHGADRLFLRHCHQRLQIPFTLSQRLCVSAARQPYRKVSIHTCLVRQILLLARHVTPGSPGSFDRP